MDIYQKIFFLACTSFGFLAVLAGAFGSHFLKGRMSPENLSVFEIAVRYQMYHGIAIIALAGIMGLIPSGMLRYSGLLFTLGTLIFSGSLYTLVFTGIKLWGAVTPVGGVLLLFGWFLALLGGILSF